MKISKSLKIESSWERRNCPLCGSSRISSRPNSSAKRPAETLSWSEVKEFFVGLRNDQVYFSYYRCLVCDLLYCPWYFTNEQIAILYSEMPNNTMGEDKSTVSRTQAAYANWILSEGVSSEAYLEVGPDIGLVSREVVSLQTPSRASFIEPNRSVREELLNNVRGVSSLEVVDYIEELSNSFFTLIVGVHVYDHLLNPVKDLRNLQKLAQKGAHLSIVVHNEKSLLRSIFKSKWPPFCLQHPQLYNPSTLEKLMKSSGWSVMRIEKSTNWYHLRFFVSMGLSVLGFKDLISKHLPNIEFPIRLGNVICLAKN